MGVVMNVFVIPPTKWEMDHAAAIVRGIRYAERHGGDLPDLPFWRDIEFRYRRNADVFAIKHGNVKLALDHLLIERAGEHETNPRPPVWPIDRPGWPPQPGPIIPPVNPPGEGCTECDPCLPAQTVPEPPAMVGMAVAIGVWFVAYLWLRKTAKGSVGEA